MSSARNPVVAPSEIIESEAARIEPIADPALAGILTSTINNKTKPLGSLGELERLALQIGLIQQTERPRLIDPAIVVFAGDHGIVEEGVSAYPQSVTWQMVENFLARGAAINVFARQHHCALHVVDAGVNHDFGKREMLVSRKMGPGTRNFLHEPAMTQEECVQAMRHGAAIAEELSGNVIGFGDMGIGNTTSAAAIMHRLTGEPVTACTGAGAGLNNEGILRKNSVIEQASARHPDANSALEVLATFGGFEIAMMAGAMLAAARRRMVILVDGFIVSSAVLVAARLQPAVLDYCVFSHCSDEKGHRLMLQHLGARPLLQLGLRLGEGSACALALPLLHSAVNFLNEMATFSSAGVAEKTA
jgi:nicotinate-nucleotide--dimethylbenzimidazole phosphoribosyltransferase